MLCFQLLQELCTVFNVDLPCRVRSSQLGIISNKQSSGGAIVTPQPSSCSYICQHCLVHLGDIGEGLIIFERGLIITIVCLLVLIAPLSGSRYSPPPPMSQLSSSCSRSFQLQ